MLVKKVETKPRDTLSRPKIRTLTGKSQAPTIVVEENRKFGNKDLHQNYFHRKLAILAVTPSLRKLIGFLGEFW